jgi:hypothetical protein
MESEFRKVAIFSKLAMRIKARNIGFERGI